MKNIHQALHVAKSPKTKKLIKKFKEELAEEFPWDKFKVKHRK
ncbi:MAG: hypothetical protein E6929_04745 [Clostridium sp.]|nr:hypothetical protein [Clostridium sp.]